MVIIKEPDKILRKKLESVKSITPSVKVMILDMKRIMKEANGVGLAANQVGHDLSIFVIDENLAAENKVSAVYINPEISDYSKDQVEAEEGCLSLPNKWLNIRRPKKIKIKALDGEGNKIKLKARGFLARVLQHETDHLNGILIKDRK